MKLTDYLIVLIIPAVMLACGTVSKNFPPGSINSIYGYRTARSMQSEESWKKAQKYMSKFFADYGMISFLSGIALSALCLAFFKRDYMPEVIMLIQTLGISAIFPIVETKLKNEIKNK